MKKNIQLSIYKLPKNENIYMTTSILIKQGSVYTYELPQNSTKYTVRLAMTPKGLWMNIQQSYMQWKLIISQDLALQTISKATANKQSLTYKQFINGINAAFMKQSQRWSIGIMTPIELEMLRGTSSTKSTNNNKIYLILSDKIKKLHFPFTFLPNDINEKDKLIDAINTMKNQLNELRNNADKSFSSFSMIIDDNTTEKDQLKIENQQLKKKIKIYEESLTQKRGAVQIDNILREKNLLEIKVETKKRQQTRQLTKLKNIHSLMQRQLTQLRNQVDLITRQLMLLQDSMGNPAKLKNHAIRVLKSYQTQLRTSKKILQKQNKDLQILKRNLNTAKNNQRKQLTKIKQIQNDIEQSKKKANIKQISNRLHSPRSNKYSKNNSSAKAQSISSNQSISKKKIGNSVASGNLVKQNLLKRTSEMFKERERKLSDSEQNNKNDLMRTAPNIKGTPEILRKKQFKPPLRPIASSQGIMTEVDYPIRQKSKQNQTLSIEHKKPQPTAADRQRQKLLIQRLTGKNKNKYTADILTNKKNDIPLSTKVSTSMPKKDNAKDILTRMKQVKALYNNRSKNSAAKEQGISVKVAELTSNKKIQ